ncbi:hypothetical protein A8B75_10580 [Sphingomonadales bacterium EhC05]|nr:hypothetical protein A8B75_10580 [Sphingomonadales bacterium EhC05]
MHINSLWPIERAEARLAEMNLPKPKLAVIGTGIAGLSSAWLLKQKYDVTIFESQPRAGMGVYTIDYRSNGIESRIDIPLRIFCRGYYDNLMALYKEIGVDVLGSDHAGAFADGKGEMILHYGNSNLGLGNFSHFKGRSWFSPRAWSLGLESRRFFARAKRDMQDTAKLADLSFGEYLDQASGEPEFVDIVLMPMMSVTCTCDYQAVRDYPADIMLEYLTCGVHELGIMSAAGGVDDIVPRLLKNIDLRTNSAIANIAECESGLSVTTVDGESDIFDHVVVAAQAQQAAKMIAKFDQQKALLERIPFQKSVMSVHTDTDLLPASDTDLSPVSYHLPQGEARAEVSVDLSKAIARLSGQESVFQTWNPLRPIAANKLLASLEFTRPTVTRDSRRAVAQLRDQQSHAGNRLWLCGSYMADKIPLLEAAVDSAVSVAEQLGADIPWKPVPA